MRPAPYADAPLRLAVLREIEIEDEFLVTRARQPLGLLTEKSPKAWWRGGLCPNAHALANPLRNLLIPPLVRSWRPLMNGLAVTPPRTPPPRKPARAPGSMWHTCVKRSRIR